MNDTNRRRGKLIGVILLISVLALGLAALLYTLFWPETVPQGGPPPTPVSVLRVEAQKLPLINELPGRIAATRVAEVRPRVSGIVEERVFTQGAFVQKDEVLFRIDPDLFKARVDSAEAALQHAIATETHAQQHYDRHKVLVQRQVTSGAEYDSASAQLAQAKANVASAKAALEEARLSLSYTEVTAPISGVIGAALITEGALVSAEGAQPLALIQQIDPIYADFTQSTSEMLALKRAFEAGDIQSVAPGEARLQLVLDDGSLYPETGRLLFSEVSVDPTTGQVTLRGEFPNASGDLLPGLYVRVQIVQAVKEAAIAIPQKAVSRDTQGIAQVYVVKDDNSLELRPIILGRSLGAWWIVERGLAPGENVLIEGLQKVRPGSVVTPEPWDSSSTPMSGLNPKGLNGDGASGDRN